MKNKLELYEVISLISPNFTQTEIEKKINYYQDFLVSQGSNVVIQDRGKRLLSYPIKGFQTTHYIQMFFSGNGDLIKALNKEVSRDTSILRNITTKVNNFNGDIL
jgi:ribosomal protein S6